MRVELMLHWADWVCAEEMSKQFGWHVGRRAAMDVLPS
jgi:hypothetical protein